MKTVSPPAGMALDGPRKRLEPGRILVAAAKLLETGGTDFSMRELARALGVDPMAVYHYFPNKTALLQALADHHFSRLGDLQIPKRAKTPRTRLRFVAEAYVELAAAAPMLTVVMARDPGVRAGVAHHFARLFGNAVEGLALGAAHAAIAGAVLADYLNGFAMAGLPASDPSLVEGVDFLYRGLAA
jgi:AcrR family transcriptional regulator